MSDINYPARHRNKTDNAKSTTRDINAAQRVQLALKLRAQRLSWDEIAAQAGYGSRGAAHHAVMRELQRCVSEDVKQMRQEELASLDLAESEIWPMFLDKKNTWRLYALDRILAIKERRAKYLGLDTPVDSAVNAGIVVVRQVPQGLLGVEAPKV